MDKKSASSHCTYLKTVLVKIHLLVLQNQNMW